MGFLARHPRFARLFVAGFVSLVGDWLSFVAVSVLALSGSGGPIELACVFAAHALPAAFASPFAGVIVDRCDRRRVLVAADVVASTLTIAMALAAAAGRTGMLPFLLLARSATTAIVPPAEAAAVRRLVAPGELVAANALLATSWSFTYVVGMALGGFATALGPAIALAIDGATFALAAGLHATLPAMPVARDDVGRDDGLRAAIASTPRDTTRALAAARRNRDLLAALVGKSPFALASGAGWVALSGLVLGPSSGTSAPVAFGALQALRGAGTGIGPALAAWARGRGVSAHAAELAARVALCAALAALAFVRDVRALGLVALVWGVSAGTNWVLSHVGIVERAGDALVGRLTAFDELLVGAATVVGTLVGALAAEAGSPRAAALVAVSLALAGWGATRTAVDRGARSPEALVERRP